MLEPIFITCAQSSCTQVIRACGHRCSAMREGKNCKSLDLNPRKPRKRPGRPWVFESADKYLPGPAKLVSRFRDLGDSPWSKNRDLGESRKPVFQAIAQVQMQERVKGSAADSKGFVSESTQGSCNSALLRVGAASLKNSPTGTGSDML